MNAPRRIVEFLEKKSISKREFYLKTGLSNGFLDKVESIGSDKISKIISAYPDINLHWLITGDGDMIEQKEPDNVLHDDGVNAYIKVRRGIKNKPQEKEKKEADEFSGVPIYDVPIDASFIERFRDNATYEPIGFLNIPKLKNCNFAAFISGNSMYPIMKSGTVAACRIVDNFDYFDEGEMYFVSTVNGFETVKYVQSGDKPGELKLIPHNGKIKATTIKKTMVVRMCIVEAWLNFR